MAKIKVETIKEGIEGREYTYFTSISDIQAEENEEVIELPSTFEGKTITHLGFYQVYDEAHEVWCDYHHPAKGSDWKEAEYKRGYSRFILPSTVKKIIVPKSIIQINDLCFSYCSGILLDFEQGSPFFRVDKLVYKKSNSEYPCIRLK